MSIYTAEILGGIFELGRMYYETGFFAAAERIFSGLVTVDNGTTPSKLALGLVKLDLGLYNEASVLFRQCIEERKYERCAKIALAVCFIATAELNRAQSLLTEVLESSSKNINYEERKLIEALLLRTSDN